MIEDDQRIKEIKKRIKSYKDFPKKGIDFKDIFPLFEQPSLLPDIVKLMSEHLTKNFSDDKVDYVFGLDSRGFLFGPQLALLLNTSFLPIRKKGKLPGNVASVSYELEYGQDKIELQKDATTKGKNCVIVDDLMATGGTMRAACQLVKGCGVKILSCYCVIEFVDLKGVNKLPEGVLFHSLVKY